MKKVIIIFFLVFLLQGINAIELTIKYRDGTSKVEHYDEHTEILSFTYGYGKNIIEITGLEKFGNLRELWLGMTSQIKDYNFLRKLNTIEVLVFQDITFSNIDFIYDMISLKRLIFQSCKINKEINAAKLPNLEYFEFTNSDLIKFPIEIREKRKIDIINVAYNKIDYIPIEECIDILIIAIDNPIHSVNNKNIVTQVDSYSFFLPEKYRQYAR